MTAKSHVICKLQLYSAMLSCKVPPRPAPIYRAMTFASARVVAYDLYLLSAANRTNGVLKPGHFNVVTVALIYMDAWCRRAYASVGEL